MLIMPTYAHSTINCRARSTCMTIPVNSKVESLCEISALRIFALVSYPRNTRYFVVIKMGRRQGVRRAHIRAIRDRRATQSSAHFHRNPPGRGRRTVSGDWGLLKPKIEIKDLSCQWFAPIASLLTATVILWDLHSIPASCNSSIGGSECWSAAF